MIFNIIVAACNNNGIGINNTIPWNSVEDMRHFSYMTKGGGNNAVVMGHNTWQSIPDNKKPLVNRENIIISKNRSLVINGCTVKHSISDVINHLNDTTCDVCWIIGGQSIYEQFLNTGLISTIIITRIKEEHDCTVHFPDLPSGFELTSTKKLGGTPHFIEYYVYF